MLLLSEYYPVLEKYCAFLQLYALQSIAQGRLCILTGHMYSCFRRYVPPSEAIPWTSPKLLLPFWPSGSPLLEHRAFQQC
jgi:hypothetical protein